MPDWNKEISFRRKPAAPKPEGATSFWKKEIGRKKKAEPKPADAVPFWKKEIGGKKKEKPAAAAEPSVPFWKREIGGKKKKEKPAAAAEPSVPFWKREIGRKKKAAPVPEPEPAPTAVAEAPPPVTPAPAEDYSWLTERLGAYAPPPAAEPEPDPDPDVPASWPPPSDGPVVAAPWPPPSDEPEPPVPPPPAAVAPAPVQPPAPARAPEPAPEPEAKTPFWKKELSLGKPKAPKEPKPAKSPKPPKPEAAERVPFWKKELSLGKTKAKVDAPVAAAEPKPEKQKGVPFWKRELSLGGGLPKARSLRREKAPKPGAGRRDKANIVGLEIGASQIAAARVHNNGAPHLVQLAREPLADGIVVGGELRDIETLADSLKRFFIKHKLPRKGVRLGIANNRIGVRTFEISGIDDQYQLANAIRFRAQETLPIPLEEAVLDWQVLREDVDENGVKRRRVLLVVAYRELVDRYVLACKKAGIRLDGIDLEAFAMLRALTQPAVDGDAPPGAQVVVNVGHDRSTFAVSDGRVCEFTRVLAWGGQNLNVAIARTLDMTPSEAAPVKHALSLEDDSVALEGVDAEGAAKACAAVRSELQAFARELVSSLRFYQNQPGSLGIAEVVVTGGTAELLGFAAELSQLVGVQVRVGDPLQRLKLSKKLHETEGAGSLAVAIGLGIED